MKTTLPVALSLFLLATACSTTSSSQTRFQVVSADPAQREALFAPLRGLEGRWESTEDHTGAVVAEFHVSSGGSALREIMFPGTEHEMTNMYTLDGNDLVMTHYCAGGNQPSMRASSREGDRIVFYFEDVQDLKALDEVYMGEMTLVFVDDEHIEQHWRALKGGQVDHETVFDLKRVR